MTNVYAVAVPLLLFASAYVGYAGLQTQARRTPRVVRDKMDMLQINTQYRIPDPFVEPMQPKGIRISIPDAPGIEMFGFHGSLNQPIVGFQAGPISGDIKRPVNGRWSFVDRNLKTKPGDVLHFWVFVQNNGLGYRKDSFRFTVKDLNDVTIEPIKKTPSIISRPPPTIEMLPELSNPPTIAMLPELTQPPTMMQDARYDPTLEIAHEINNSIEEDSISKTEFLKVQKQLNDTLALLQTLNEKIDPLNRELKLLRETVSDLARSAAGNTKLILRHTGNRIPGNSLELVRSIVVERLGLFDFYSKILAATQIPDGIVFDVPSMYEKRLILTRAKDELKMSKFKIEEYNGDMPPPNTNCIPIVDDIQFPRTASIPKLTTTIGTTIGDETVQPTGTTIGRETNQPTNILPTDSITDDDGIEFPTSGSDTEGPTDTTWSRQPDQPTDILPTDSLDSFEDEIFKKIDIRRASGEEVRTTLGF